MTNESQKKEETADEKYVRMALAYVGASSYEDFEDFVRRHNLKGKTREEREYKIDDNE